MPKLKSNRGAAKRFKVKKSGKVQAKHAKSRHLLTHAKNRVKKRSLQGTFIMADPDAKKVKAQLLPYG